MLPTHKKLSVGLHSKSSSSLNSSETVYYDLPMINNLLNSFLTFNSFAPVFNEQNKITKSQVKTIKTILDQASDYYSVREIRFEDKQTTKTNIRDFYIKTNELDESRIKVLIDSGSNINCIHPDVVKKLGIQTEKIKKPFNVSGLGYGIPTVSKETEKCILRFKNHLEIIQLHVLRIPDVDVILSLPWINKHCPSNYHDSSKIAFSSGFCARHCNNGKRKRNNKKKSNSKNKMVLLENELIKSKEDNKNEESSCSNQGVHYDWDFETD